MFAAEHTKHPEGCTEGGMHSTDRHDGLHRFYHRRRPERSRQDIHRGWHARRRNAVLQNKVWAWSMSYISIFLSVFAQFRTENLCRRCILRKISNCVKTSRFNDILLIFKPSSFCSVEPNSFFKPVWCIYSRWVHGRVRTSFNFVYSNCGLSFTS